MGSFIVFEGIEGCGKTTQIQHLAGFLSEKNLPLTVTREPGGTRLGDGIRAVFLNAGHRDISPLAELLLVLAARVQHVQSVIRPALENNGIVLCDRFYDATAAYQGSAGGVDRALIDRCHNEFVSGLTPDLTLLLDCPVEVGLERSRERNRRDGIEIAEGRFEEKDLVFHRLVRDGYRERARQAPERFRVIDGTLPVADIRNTVRDIVIQLLEKKGYAV